MQMTVGRFALRAGVNACNNEFVLRNHNIRLHLITKGK